MWTRPADRAPPCGPCGQAMEKLRFPTACPHSALSRPQPHRFCNNDSSERQRLQPAPGLLRHPRKSGYGTLRPIAVGIPRPIARNNSPAVRAGTDAAGHPGEVLHLANGRCPSADRRRAASDVAAPHPAHTRPPTAAASTQAAIARTTAAAHLGVAPRQDTSQTAPCSADLWRPSTNNQSFMTVLALSCGSRA